MYSPEDRHQAPLQHPVLQSMLRICNIGQMIIKLLSQVLLHRLTLSLILILVTANVPCSTIIRPAPLGHRQPPELPTIDLEDFGNPITIT